MNLKLVQKEEASIKNFEKPRILVLGPAAHGIAGALFRLQSRAEVCGAETIQEALAYLRTGMFDHVLVDNRVECGLTLPITELGRDGSVKNLIVLADLSCCPDIDEISGVDRIISPPYNPVEIAESLGIEIVDNRRQQFENYQKHRGPTDIKPHSHFASGIPFATSAKLKELQALLGNQKWLVGVVPSLTPVFSLIYKHVALTLLACLFVAFISYGIMIVYFLTSGDWATPIQLQRGHELVIKAERERGELKVKRNLILQQIADAESKAERGKSAIRRANTIAKIADVTIDQEIENRRNRDKLIEGEIDALKEVVRSYGPAKNRISEKQSLHRDYKRRIITRRIYETSLLNLAEIEKNIVTLREQISRKQTEGMILRQGVAYMTLLKEQLAAGDGSIAMVGGKAEFVPIANQIIEVQQVRAAGIADIADFESNRQTLENSIDVLSKSILALEKSPLIRALDDPVNVLFVPYDNISAYQIGEPLFTCAFAIFWCNKVGSVGHPIGGEISTIHPFFSKPIRGQFIEAELSEVSAVQEEIFHVGRPPLFF